VAECHAELLEDDATRTRAWQLLRDAPEPVGYDPASVPGWETPTSPAFAVLRVRPWRVRVFPGTVLLGQGGEVLVWQSDTAHQGLTADEGTPVG
jgi:anti-sigma factor RsiW